MGTMKAALDIIHLASVLRAEPSINWPEIVGNAGWIVPREQANQGILWMDAQTDLSNRFPMKLRAHWADAEIAAAERAAGKPLGGD